MTSRVGPVTCNVVPEQEHRSFLDRKARNQASSSSTETLYTQGVTMKPVDTSKRHPRSLSTITVGGSILAQIRAPFFHFSLAAETGGQDEGLCRRLRDKFQ